MVKGTSNIIFIREETDIQSGSRTPTRSYSPWRVKAGSQHRPPMSRARVASLREFFVVIQAGRPGAILSVSILFILQEPTTVCKTFSIPIPSLSYANSTCMFFFPPSFIEMQITLCKFKLSEHSKMHSRKTALPWLSNATCLRSLCIRT